MPITGKPPERTIQYFRGVKAELDRLISADEDYRNRWEMLKKHLLELPPYDFPDGGVHLDPEKFAIYDENSNLVSHLHSVQLDAGRICDTALRIAYYVKVERVIIIAKIFVE